MSGITVYDQPHVLREVEIHLLDNPHDFSQFFHQVVFVVEAPCGIYQHHVAVTCQCRIAGVKGYRSGVGTLLVLYEFGAAALCPCFQLFDCCCAESIAGRNHDFFAFVFKACGQFSDSGSLAGAIYPDDQDDMRLALQFKGRRVLEQAFSLAPHNVEDLFGGKRLA